MNNALALNNDLYIVNVNAEKPLCLDYFKTLVHQRCAVNRNLCAHRPVGVTERVRLCDTRKLRAGFAEKRTSGGGEQDFFKLRAVSAVKALENRGVFTVDREQPNALFGNGVHKYTACGNKSFLIGKGDVLARADCVKGRNKTRKADYGRKHHVGFLKRCNFNQTLLAAEDAYIRVRKADGKLPHSAFVSHGNRFGAVFLSLLFKKVNVGFPRKGNHVYCLYPPKVVNNLQSLCSD